MDISNISLTPRNNFKKELINDKLQLYLTPNDHNLNQFAIAVRTGLNSKHKFLHPKYLYDERGSKLFKQICEQPEYYITRMESSILESSSDKIANMCNEITLVELGSGNSEKTRIILDKLIARLSSVRYVPLDISYDMLKESSINLLDKYQSLSITAVVAEYYEGMALIKKELTSRKLVIFLGSSLGNFEPEEGKKFMRMIRNHIQDQDMFLIGLDLHKDSGILNAAYNDLKGFTAQFNMNILSRINRELGGNFCPDKFEHYAFYNESKRRVEMHLISKVEQEVKISGIGEIISFREGEKIHTESSYKFTAEQIENLIEGSFQVVQTWIDKKKWYNVILLVPTK